MSIKIKFFLAFAFIAATALFFYSQFKSYNLKLSPTESGAPYPRLANYFLDWDVYDEEIPQLAKWDVLVLSPQAEERNPGLLKELKRLNPEIKILVYQLTQESSPIFSEEVDGTYAKTIYDQIDKNNWWLKDVDGEFVSHWQANRIINITENTQWVDYLTNFVAKNYFQAHPEYDGVFYDNVWYDISWLPNVQVDLNYDGSSDDDLSGDEKWRQATVKILEKTRQLNPEKLIIGNVNFSFFDTYVNGKMFENFGRNQKFTWAELMGEVTDRGYGHEPRLVLVNENTENQDLPNDYQRMRFGLTSTLLSDAYFAYDMGDCCHNNIWWYDEYSVNLGHPTSKPLKLYKLFGQTRWLAKSPQPGVWLRKFEKGIALVNATDKDQLITLDKKYRKISGQQDQVHNDGSAVNAITLKARDGILLLND